MRNKLLTDVSVILCVLLAFWFFADEESLSYFIIGVGRFIARTLAF